MKSELLSQPVRVCISIACLIAGLGIGTLLQADSPRRGDPKPLATVISALVDLVDALDGVKGVDLEEAKTAAEAAIAQSVEEAR